MAKLAMERELTETVVEFWPVASVTVRVKLKVPDIVGVPESTPPVLNERPAGSVDPAANVHV